MPTQAKASRATPVPERALARIHASELARHYEQAAKKSGETGKLHAGAVTFVQRLGSSLNLHVHLHTCARGGVDVDVEGEEGEALRFVPRAPPSRAELYVLTERNALPVTTWLRKRAHAKDDDHASNDTKGRTFAEVRGLLATQRGTVENVKDDTGESEGLAEPAAESDCAGTAFARPSTPSGIAKRVRSRASACCGTDAGSYRVKMASRAGQGSGHLLATRPGPSSRPGCRFPRRPSHAASRGGRPDAERPVGQTQKPHPRRPPLRRDLERAVGHVARSDLRRQRTVGRPPCARLRLRSGTAPCGPSLFVRRPGS